VVLAAVWTLQWARAFFIPVVVGVMLSYALSPIVNCLQHWRIPRALGAAIVLIGIVGPIGMLTYSLSDDAAALIETLPEATRNLRRTLGQQRLDASAIDHVQQAANELANAAAENGGGAESTPAGVTRVQIEEPALNIRNYLLTGTLGAFALAGQVGIVLFLVFFLLTAGNTFRRKVVKIAGPTFGHKRISIQVLDDITSQIQRYLLVQVGTSVIVGVATWLAFLWIGLEHAAIWGVAAAIFNIVPYVGPVVVTGGTSLVALLQFGTIEMAVLVGGVSLLITSLEGYLLTPWLTSRAGRMNAVAIFVGVLLWGWLWGVWGLLLGIPIMMVIKAVCDQVEDLNAFGELLAE
jgi:predicted PurR-regulated permease PerM